MNEISLKACMLGLLGVTIICLTSLVITGHDSVVTDSLLGITTLTGGLGIWERLKK